MIFFKIDVEPVVQVDDAFRIFSRAFISPDEGSVTLIRLSPDNGTTWIDVTNADPDKTVLDWAYSTPGTQTIKQEITTTNTAATEKDFTVEIVSVEDDCLFSSDQDLKKFEPEIECFLRIGRKSFLDVHRCSQKLILDWLQRQVEVKDCDIDTDDGCVKRKLTCQDLWDKEEVHTWSVYQTLVLIFEGLSNQTDDVFAQKALRYSEHMYRARSRAEITVDYDQDGKADYREKIHTARLTRR